ncbi:LacI family DNA-binding transcriptional regulator [Thermosediminibacter litoriperuensis]|uniref:LacI family transcriptional regulator n=1 Tax=Thermosediminibacter litoriperuensis TaxID=291989 RepID=A0A5S5ANV3_9FIRM|nr:LacI family DNA-binding transcriptional regulator [Thermosediminibacter litoriperuensis]TYP53337.1 LacI family transcriptional regulator [Thermosediminibacter litoriperuensis]
MPATIYDVAKRARVSIATVSRVLNNSDLVSEKTRERVKKAMEELNYSPNVIASALTKKSILTLGLLIPDIANPFFAELARGVEDASVDFGFNIIICNTDYRSDKETEYIRLLKQKSIDGFIISTAYYNDENVINLIKSNTPLVLMGRDIDRADMPVDVVVSDNVRGGYIATKHLIDLGHKNIACLLGPPQIKVNLEREKGYLKALEETNLKVRPELVAFGEFKVEFGFRKAIEILNSVHKPTAFFAANDLTAIGVIKAARYMGLEVPRDISVVGYDNTMLAEMVDPPLTTINQQMRKMGYMATELLIKRIKGKRSPGQKIVLDVDLVVRRSTGELFNRG